MYSYFSFREMEQDESERKDVDDDDNGLCTKYCIFGIGSRNDCGLCVILPPLHEKTKSLLAAVVGFVYR